MTEMMTQLQRAARAYQTYYTNEQKMVRLRRFVRYPQKTLVMALTRLGVMKRDLPRSATTFWGSEIMVLPQDSNAGSLYYFGFLPEREYRLTQHLITTLKASDVVYDIGANYGFIGAVAEEVCTTGEVHIFEPHPLLFACLEETFAQSGGVHLNKAACAETTGMISFFDAYDHRHSGGSTTIQRVAAENPNSYREIRVEAVKLDSYAANHTPPTLMKIDVEGAEYQVLKGAKHLIREYRPVIIAELWGGKNWAVYSQPVADLLREWRYTPHLILEGGELQEVQYEELEERVSAASYENIVFCP